MRIANLQLRRQGQEHERVADRSRLGSDADRLHLIQLRWIGGKEVDGFEAAKLEAGNSGTERLPSQLASQLANQLAYRGGDHCGLILNQGA